MTGDEIPDPLSGHRVVGQLTLPELVAAVVARVAADRGLTELQLIREVVARWALEQAGG